MPSANVVRQYRAVHGVPVPPRAPDGPAFDIDLDRAVDDLRRIFPGICLWWGEYTGSLWALLPEGLVEAKNARDLAERIRVVLERRDSRIVVGGRAGGAGRLRCPAFRRVRCPVADERPA